MKKEEVIKQLQELPDGVEVCIFDVRKNLSEDSGDEEGTGAGIYSRFLIKMMHKHDVPKGKPTFAILEFDNDDYHQDGTKSDYSEA